MGRNHCWNCQRPESVCLCDTFANFLLGTSVTILAHPREARRGTSSGFLAHRNLTNSRYLVDFDFEKSVELQKILADPNIESLLLYPKVGAVPISTIHRNVALVSNEPVQLNRPKINLVVIEGTWAHARTQLNHSPTLQSLPAVTLDYPRPSRFQIRSQPKPRFLATIEAIAYALEDWGEFSEAQVESFLGPFLEMIATHLDYQKRNLPRYRFKTKSSQI